MVELTTIFNFYQKQLRLINSITPAAQGES